jgi:hypothetical protein
MATQWQTFPIEFRGGLISNLTPLQQGSNAVGSATILQNFEVNKEGGYSKIRGYSKYSTSQLAGSGSLLALKVISSGRIVAARKNSSNLTQYYYSTGNSWSSIGTSAGTGGGKAKSVLYNLDGVDKVVFVDGVNFPAVYSTSGNSLDFFKNDSSGDPFDIGTSDPLGAEHVAIFKNTAFYAKGNTIFFTAPFSVSDFNVANGAGSINVANNITGLAVFREQLIIFTSDTIKKLTGSSAADFQVSPITDRIGCINGDTIQEVGGDIMYLSPDGIRLLSATDRIGDFGLDVASDSIAKDATLFLNQSPLFCSVVLKEKSQYRIFSYVQSEQVEAAKGLIATKFISQGAGGLAWSTTKGIKAFIADSRYTGTAETLAFGNDDGYVYVMETGADFNGLPIEAIYESPFMPVTDPQVRKTFYKMTLYADPSASMTLDLNVKYDFASATDTKIVQPATQQISSTGSSVFFFGASNSVFNNSTYGGELDKVYNTNIIGSGKTVAIRFEDFSTNPTFTLDTALLEYSQEDRQ